MLTCANLETAAASARPGLRQSLCPGGGDSAAAEEQRRLRCFLRACQAAREECGASVNAHPDNAAIYLMARQGQLGAAQEMDRAVWTEKDRSPLPDYTSLNRLRRCYRPTQPETVFPLHPRPCRQWTRARLHCRAPAEPGWPGRRETGWSSKGSRYLSGSDTGRK